MKNCSILISCLLYSLIFRAQVAPDTTQKVIPGRVNSPEQQQKPYVILISGDGFRYDYAEQYHAVYLQAFGEEGVRAESMIPSYPSLTFPNHYTIVTGLYPSHHGLVSNYFYDRKRNDTYSMRNQKTVQDGSWYGGTPLWVLAEQQQMLSASFYWVGSEADIKGIFPTYYYAYNEVISIDRRIQIVKEWLQLPAERRPHFISMYFPEVDHQGHSFGPDAEQTGMAVRWLDSSILKLTEAVKSTGLPVNFIFISDHGMTKVDTDNALPMPSAVDTTKFIIPRGAELVALYAKNKEDIKTTGEKLKKEEKDYMTWFRTDMPARLHYGMQDDTMDRIGDILLVPVWPKTFNFSTHKPNPGAHGYDPFLVHDMKATFIAWGPAFHSHLKIGSFENVNVFPVVARILGLKIKEKIDGTPDIANQVLK